MLSKLANVLFFVEVYYMPNFFRSIFPNQIKKLFTNALMLI